MNCFSSENQQANGKKKSSIIKQKNTVCQQLTSKNMTVTVTTRGLGH